MSMLQEKGFYRLLSKVETPEGKYLVTIELNKEHDIFNGHFPGNPVTPGACMMQIVKELSEEITGSKLRMVQASNVKFMALINPLTHPQLELELDVSRDSNGNFKVKNTAKFEETVALKMNNTFAQV